MLRKLGQYLLANPFQAAGFAFLCALLPLIAVPGGFIAAIIVGFITLCRGHKTGLLVLFGVAIPVIVMALWQRTFLFDLVFVRCALVWLFAGILRHTRSWRLVLEVMMPLGLLTVLGFHWILPDVPAWWLNIFQNYGSLFAQEGVEELLPQMMPIATGLFVVLVLLGAFAQLLFARYWQAVLFRPGGLAQEFVEIRNSPVLAIVFTIIGLMALWGVTIAKDVFPVVVFPFAIVGLSIAHKWARYKKEIMFLLVAIYLGLVFLPAVVIAVLTLAGYTDSWYDLRKRYLKNRPI